jgi:hypothetical protein
MGEAVKTYDAKTYDHSKSDGNAGAQYDHQEFGEYGVKKPSKPTAGHPLTPEQ